MTLTEFLLARIAEDEAVDPVYGFLLNIELHESGCLELGAVERSDADCDCSGPKRWLAEVGAKRRIVALHHPSGEYDAGYDACVLCQWDIDCESPRADYHDGAGRFPCDTVKVLALPYANHPDYQQEWKP